MMTVRIRTALPVAVSVLTGLVVATGYLLLHAPPRTDALGRWAQTSPSSASPAGPVPSDWPEPEGVPDPFRTAQPVVNGAPTRLRVASVGIDTALETLHLGADGELVPPRGNARAGWYADGTAPGDVGPAVLAGHVDSRSGPAVFYRLREVDTGDRIDVVRGGRTVTFTVTATAWYPKSDFPTERVYGPTPDRQLRLITCGGVFDRSLRSYRDNLVVYAVAG